ncbi:hypothetical protein H1Q63_27770 [Desmonostoc muscorum CCALA 125]|nr:hypothetical protein [Desmonostoc muscorum]MBX9257677.1 hypothetical protein [Desmonostoc muscorum CCALA 125]MCF2147894.1 hypothetical protein [Desmonostoc muscorum LEGE 12446]
MPNILLKCLAMKQANTALEPIAERQSARDGSYLRLLNFAVRPDLGG